VKKGEDSGTYLLSSTRNLKENKSYCKTPQNHSGVFLLLLAGSILRPLPFVTSHLRPFATEHYSPQDHLFPQEFPPLGTEFYFAGYFEFLLAQSFGTAFYSAINF